VPVIDHWWQTETGWAICANCMGIEHLPVKAGSPTKPVPGVDIRVLDNEGQEVERNTLGALVIKLPLPPGNFPTLWQAEERFQKTYLDTFPGFYQTYDAGIVDDDGYVHVMSRTDDIINVAGHRLSTGAMEEVLAAHPNVAECAVIGVHDQLKGQVPLGFLVLKAGVSRPEAEIVREVVGMVREKIGPVAAFKTRRSSSGCRRPARARSCAGSCAGSPIPSPTTCPRRSTTRRSSGRWPRPSGTSATRSRPSSPGRRGGPAAPRRRCCPGPPRAARVEGVCGGPQPACARARRCLAGTHQGAPGRLGRPIFGECGRRRGGSGWRRRRSGRSGS